MITLLKIVKTALATAAESHAGAALHGGWRRQYYTPVAAMGHIGSTRCHGHFICVLGRCSDTPTVHQGSRLLLAAG